MLGENRAWAAYYLPAGMRDGKWILRRFGDCREPFAALKWPDVNPEIPLPPELERFWRTDDGLTACERAAAYGIDLSLLDENLRLTPEERIKRHDLILNEAESLRNAYLAQRDQPNSNHPASR